jgi:hypothetical protein
MFITNKALRSTAHAVFALHIRSLALCIATTVQSERSEGGTHHQTNSKIGGPGLASLRFVPMRCRTPLRRLRLVQIGVRVPVHPWVVPSLAQLSSESAGIRLGAVLRAEKRQVRYLVSEVFVLKRRR